MDATIIDQQEREIPPAIVLNDAIFMSRSRWYNVSYQTDYIQRYI